jgi:apolipoprotein D and lipocalin family protein
MVHPILTVLVLALATPSFAVGGWGGCPDVSVVQNFNLTQYLGQWYEIVRTADMPFEHGTCDQAHYSLLPSGRVNVTNTEIDNGKLSVAHGEAYCDNDGSANCHVRFSRFSPWGGYQVLDTDYKSYTVILSCSSIGIYHWSWGWVLSRTHTLEGNNHTDLLLGAGLKEKDLLWTNQTSC